MRAGIWARETTASVDVQAEPEELLWLGNLNASKECVIAPLSAEHLLPNWQQRPG